uniref:Sugar transporter SWEET1 n=1 Tax=Heterorhabditis bacteriophora TaxID=37862 RepID=A0A1I7XUL7_HETBA
MFEIFTHGVTFLNLLSILAFFTTVGLFFCGIPICRQIWKRKDTSEISGAPFLMGILGGCCWMTYGYLKNDYTVMVVTSCQVVLYSSYTIFYWIMTKDKLWISLKVGAVLSMCTILILSVHFFGKKVFHPLGIICMTLNTADFAAPLAGLRVVIRRRATSTLPLPLCIANFLVSSEWFVYGLLVKDFYLITPNGIGSFLALIQLLLFVVLPRKPGQHSLLRKIFSCFKSQDECDLEDPTKEIVLDLGPDDKKITRAQRWSKKVISNVSTVAEELENVISKVGIHDQFAYKHKISNEYDTASEKTVETLDEKVEKIVSGDDILAQSEKEVKKLRNSLRATGESQRNMLRRTFSSPDFTE